MNPLHSEVKSAIMAADVLAGNDENCAAWIQQFRDPGSEPVGAGRRRGGRRRRPTE
jgi:5-methyltetrahydrofolate--homocysteine methyltransferase